MSPQPSLTIFLLFLFLLSLKNLSMLFITPTVLPHNLLYGLGCLDILILNIQFIFIQYAVFKVRMQNRMFGLVLEARFHKQV